MTVAAIFGKLACAAGVLQGGVRRLGVAVGMIPRGEVSLIFAQIGFASGLLSAGLFSAIAVMVMITALITPLALRMLLPKGPALEREADLMMDAPMEDEPREAAR